MEITRETLISEIIDNCPPGFPCFSGDWYALHGLRACQRRDPSSRHVPRTVLTLMSFLTYLKAYLEVSNP